MSIKISLLASKHMVHLSLFSFLRHVQVPNLSICCSVFLSLSGKSGSKTFVAKRFLPRGEKEQDGVTVIEMNCTYFWAPLAEIDFSVGVVVPVSHAKDQLNSLNIPAGKFHKSWYICHWCCLEMSVSSLLYPVVCFINEASSTKLSMERQNPLWSLYINWLRFLTLIYLSNTI